MIKRALKNFVLYGAIGAIIVSVYSVLIFWGTPWQIIFEQAVISALVGGCVGGLCGAIMGEIADGIVRWV